MASRFILAPSSALNVTRLVLRQPYRCLAYSARTSLVAPQSTSQLLRQSTTPTHIQQYRNLHTTRQQWDKKKDDKDKDKKKSFEFSGSATISPAHMIGAVLAFILLFPQIKAQAGYSSHKTIEYPEFAKLAKENKIKKMEYDDAQNCCEVIGNSGERMVLRGATFNAVQARLEQIYESISLHPADRLIITKKSPDAMMGASNGLIDMIFSPTMLLITFFAFMYMPNLRNKLTEAFKPQNLNQVKDQAKKGGKAAKKEKKSSGGGFFGGMGGQMEAVNKKIGTVVDPEDIKVGFHDVAGCEEAKIEVIEIVDFLKNEKKYKQMGAKVPKGAILHGPPGTGKTLLAKACAKEAGVNFVQCNGSEFIEMFVGLGAKRVREVFDSARENSPCILFIDEIDAVGKKRGKGMGGGNQEADQTINAFLAEMDGFNTDEPVVVMGATNQLDSLDSALTRPGRFDRKIYVGLPDIKGRNSIFNVHLQRIHTSLDKKDLAKKLSVKTPGMSGADIDNIVNEAALNAVRYGDSEVTMVNCERAIDRVIAGMEKKNDIMDPKTKRRVALHEAGHAAVSWFLEHGNPLVKVTIVPRTEGALGFAMYQPQENMLHTQEYYKHQICVALGGRAAEEVFYDGSVSSGAHDDLKKVGNQAYVMVARIGMSEKLYNHNIEDTFQAISPNGARSSYPSEKTKQLIDDEIKKIIDDQYELTLNIIREKKDLVEKLADVLLEKETIGRDEVVACLGPRPYTEKHTYEDMVADLKSKEEDLSLPPGLKHWEKSFKNSEKFKPRERVEQEKQQAAAKESQSSRYVLPPGWEKKTDTTVGSYYLNQEKKISTMRNPGKPLPSGWRSVVDAEGREKFHHESGFDSWLLEDDPELPKALRDAINDEAKKQ